LGGTYENFGSGNLLFRGLPLQQAHGGVIAEVDQDLQKQLGDTHLVAWSDLLDGYVLSTIEWREEHAAGDDEPAHVFGLGAVGDDRTLLLTGKAVADLPGKGLSLRIVTDVPSLKATALLGGRSLTIITPRLHATEVARLNPGDDYGGFEAPYETRDKGWLYAVGDQ
jgi:hypothetical protein